MTSSPQHDHEPATELDALRRQIAQLRATAASQQALIRTLRRSGGQAAESTHPETHPETHLETHPETHSEAHPETDAAATETDHVQPAAHHVLHGHTPAEDLRATLDRLTELAVRQAGAKAAVLLLRRATALSVEVASVHGLPAGSWTTAPEPWRYLTEQALRAGETIAVDDYGAWAARQSPFPDFTIGRVLAIPFAPEDSVDGVLLIMDTSTGPFSTVDMQSLELVAGQAAALVGQTRFIHELQQTMADLYAEQEEMVRLVDGHTHELNAARAESARALRLKDEFLASVSHELRTPLSTILLLTQMLQRGLHGPLNDRQKHSLETIDRSGRHLLDLINDILDLSKIEAGKLELTLAPVNITHVCQLSLEFVQQMAQSKEIELQRAFDIPHASLMADERRIKQILINLLSNAIKFTPRGGEVGLDVTAQDGGTALQIAIWDTGIGIDEEDLPQLFKPFVQLDSGLDRRHEGTGLGLALVYRMVELHGGSIQVESRKGSGSRFTVSLPWRRLDAPKEIHPGRGETRQTSPSTILGRSPVGESRTGNPAVGAGTSIGALVLVAEDNLLTADAIITFLKSQGFQTLHARTGAQALELALNHHPNLILMDIQMPVLDGLTAIRRLRADADFAATPIIAVTSLAMAGDRERCLAAGATDYLSKPLHLDALLELLQRRLAG